MGDQLARKVTMEEVKDREDRAKFKYAYWANNMEEPVHLHQGSVLRKTLPEFVVSLTTLPVLPNATKTQY